MNLQRITLVNGDCFEIMAKMPNKSIDLVVTDPPYLHNTSRSGGGHSKLATSEMYKKSGMVMDKMSSFTPDYCRKMLDELDRILKKFDGYFFCNERLVGTYCAWAEEHKYLVNILTWNKPLSVLNRMRYSTNIEYIVRIHTASGTALNRLDTKNNPSLAQFYSKYQSVPRPAGKEKIHPTQKPVELLKGYILLSSKENGVVFDPFMGSCSTGVACIETNRQFVGIEIDKDIFDLAKKRISEINERGAENEQITFV